jgi:hypothetical protein
MAAAVRARFDGQPPQNVYQAGDDRIGVWDADDFAPWETLRWPAVRVLRYRQHKRDGTVVEAEWLTGFSIARLGSLSFYRIAKSRWEIENQGLDDGKSRYGMEHIRHHEPNGIPIVWLSLLLALVIERLYRLRHQRRSGRGVRSAINLLDSLWLSLGSRRRPGTSRDASPTLTTRPFPPIPASRQFRDGCRGGPRLVRVRGTVYSGKSRQAQ